MPPKICTTQNSITSLAKRPYGYDQQTEKHHKPAPKAMKACATKVVFGYEDNVIAENVVSMVNATSRKNIVIQEKMPMKIIHTKLSENSQ
ncbi:MAG: hypothetical protein LBG19_13200 [Prevotellaceae bacterium]|jgi:hypothetical protein|nr:hypothetical protein [Prevotellaceae bacterium]